MPIDLLEGLDDEKSSSGGPRDLIADYERKQGVSVDPSNTAPKTNVGGIGAALAGGAQQTGRALGSFVDVLQGDEEEIFEDNATPTTKTGAQTRFGEAIERRKEEFGDDELWQSIKNVAGAAYEEPMGALHETAAMLPNSGVILGGMAAGAKAGAMAGTAVNPGAGTAVGAIVGGIAGMFAGNTAIETGFIAGEMAGEGDVDTGKALRQGVTKGGVITAVDTATLGLNKLLMGGPGKAASKAVEKLFIKNGLGKADDAARLAAMKADPNLNRVIREGGTAAFVNAMPGKLKKTALATAGVGLESFSEGAGEYLGSKAAGLDASLTDAVLEAMMSLPQSGIETGIAATLGKKSAEADLQRALAGTDPGFTPPDRPSTEGYEVEEVEDTVVPAPGAEPIPRTAEGIEVEEIPQTPLQMMANRFRERVGGRAAAAGIESNIEEIDVDQVPVPGGPEPSVEALTTRLITETSHQKAELEKRTAEKEAKDEEFKTQAAEVEKKRRAKDDIEGVRESIKSRRSAASDALKSGPAEGQTRDQQIDEYIDTVDALDEEEAALKTLEAGQKKAPSQKVAKKEGPLERVEPLPVGEVKELDPGVLDEKRPKSGKPYASRKSAENIKKIVPKYANYEVVEKDGGFVLQDKGKQPPAPSTEGIEVEELKKIPGPKPKIGKAPKRVPGGSALRDALKGAGVKPATQAKIEELYPNVFGDLSYEVGIEPADIDVDAILRGDIPNALKRQGGEPDTISPSDPNLDGRPFDQEITGPTPRNPRFLDRDENTPIPPQNGRPDDFPIGEAPIETGPTGSPYDKNPEDWTEDDIQAIFDEQAGETEAVAEEEEAPEPEPETPPRDPATIELEKRAARRKAKAQIDAEIRAKGLNRSSPEGEEMATRLRKERGLDDDYNPIQGPTTDEGGEAAPVETGPTGGGAGGGSATFAPVEIEDDQTAFNLDDEGLSAINIVDEFDDEEMGQGSIETPANVLLKISRKRLDVLNKLGACVS